MDLLIVERNADWSRWNRLAAGLSQPVLVLVQQADESPMVFYSRVARRVTHADTPAIKRIVALRASCADAMVISVTGQQSSTSAMGKRSSVEAEKAAQALRL
jgi:hypothetical protein